MKFQSFVLGLLATAIVGSSAVARPATPAPACAGLAASRCLPIERGDGDTPVVRVSLNGQGPFFYVLDTASSGTTVDEAAAGRLGLVRDTATEQGQGMGGAVDVRLYRVAALLAGPLTLRDYVSPGVPAPAFSSHAISGIAGIDLFGDRLAIWDARRGRVEFGRSGDRPSGRGWSKVEARWLKPWKVMVPVDVGGVRGWGLVDTGAQHTVLNPTFATALGLTEASGRLRAGGEISGLDGAPLALREADLAGVRIGGWRLGPTSVKIGALPVFDRLGDPDQPLMIIGIDWLKSQAFAIDYGAEAVWQKAE